MAEENIDNTVNGSGLFNTKIPGLSDAADIQAALRLYHYGSYTYDGANQDKNLLVNPSIAKHLQNLVDADAAEVVNRNAAIATHNSATTNVHGIEDTSLLATQLYVDGAIEDAISGATGGYPSLAGVGLDWNADTEKFDVEPRIANAGTIVIKTSGFTLYPVDVSKTIILNTSSPMNLTIPSNSSVSIPVGYQFNFIEIGTGRTTFSPDSSVVINSKNAQMYIDAQYGKATLLKIAEDEWILFGDIYEGSTVTPPFFPPSFVASPFFPPSFIAPPFFPPSFIAPPSFPFFPPSFIESPFFPPSFIATPFFPPSFITPVVNYATFCGDGVARSGNSTGTCAELEQLANATYTTVTNFVCQAGSSPSLPTCTPIEYDIYVYCDGLGGVYSGAYGTQTPGQFVTVGTTTDPDLTSNEIIAICGIPTGCQPASPFFPPSFISNPVVVPGTVYLSYCFEGTPTQDTFAVDENNVVTTNINNACSAYNALLSGIGATNISCSTTSMPALPTNCVASPFFPPSFIATPFFPPSFIAAPFFPPFFPPSFVGTSGGWFASYCFDGSAFSEGGPEFTTIGSIQSFMSVNYPGATNIIYQQGSAPALPSCVSSPFFPPSFIAAPFFPPFFPPSFVAAPFFPPSFIATPFFPPSFVSGTPTIVSITNGDCYYYSSCPQSGELLQVINYSDGSTTYDYQCCSYSGPA